MRLAGLGVAADAAAVGGSSKFSLTLGQPANARKRDGGSFHRRGWAVMVREFSSGRTHSTLQKVSRRQSPKLDPQEPTMVLEFCRGARGYGVPKKREVARRKAATRPADCPPPTWRRAGSATRKSQEGAQLCTHSRVGDRRGRSCTPPPGKGRALLSQQQRCRAWLLRPWRGSRKPRSRPEALGPLLPPKFSKCRRAVQCKKVVSDFP